MSRVVNKLFFLLMKIECVNFRLLNKSILSFLHGNVVLFLEIIF